MTKTILTKLLQNSANIFLSLLLIPVVAMAQDGTTLEEYRYLTKGYAYQQSMGLDASKEGYVIKPLAAPTAETEFIGLYKNGFTKVQAVLLVLQRDTETPIYVCIPNKAAPKTVKDLRKRDLQQLSEPKLKAQYQLALEQLVMVLLNETQNAPLTFSMNEAPMERSDGGTFTTKGISSYEENTNTSRLEVYDLDSEDVVASGAINESVAVTLDQELVDRGVFNPPVIKTNYEAKGKVAIKFCVDAEGNVSSAKFTQLGSTTFNSSLIELAKQSVREAQFAKGKINDCGKAIFHFK
ncbi:MAG: hypothetical protein AB8F74_13475 [Saprospiraceae bacterium]